jgi:predicted RNase H-like HicB family nuclease
MTTFNIQAFWDEEARVWVAESSQVPGLCTEAATLELLSEKIQVMIPELLENIPANSKVHLEAHREMTLVA